MGCGKEHDCFFAGLEFVTFFVFPIPWASPGIFLFVHGIPVIENPLWMNLRDQAVSYSRVGVEPMINPEPVHIYANLVPDHHHRNQNEEPDQAEEPSHSSFG